MECVPAPTCGCIVDEELGIENCAGNTQCLDCLAATIEEASHKTNSSDCLALKMSRVCATIDYVPQPCVFLPREQACFLCGIPGYSEACDAPYISCSANIGGAPGGDGYSIYSCGNPYAEGIIHWEPCVCQLKTTYSCIPTVIDGDSFCTCEKILQGYVRCGECTPVAFSDPCGDPGGYYVTCTDFCPTFDLEIGCCACSSASTILNGGEYFCSITDTEASISAPSPSVDV